MQVVLPSLRRCSSAKSAALQIVSALAATLSPGLAAADKHEINAMGARWVPPVLFIKLGDSVVWLGMLGHETQLIEGLAPPGTETWKSGLGEEGFKVTFDQAGVYIYKCETHVTAGMIGAIVVGDGEPPNLAAINTAMSRVGPGRGFVQAIVARVRRELRYRADK